MAVTWKKYGIYPPGTFNNGPTPAEKNKNILIYKNANMKLLKNRKYGKHMEHTPRDI